jgi:FkbM family methyltransferase
MAAEHREPSRPSSSIAGRTLHAIVSHVPERVLNRVGGWELRHAWFRRVVRWTMRPMQATDTVITQGVGAGLLFKSSGGFPSRALGHVEPEVQEVLAELLRPGDAFYDVGANIGYFTLIGARLVSPTGRVVAVEPQPSALHRLRHNLAINGFDNVTVIEAAIADEEGECDLMVSPEGILEWAALAPSPIPGVPTIPVRVTTLDKLRADLPPPRVVKLDVEGAEGQAVRGMHEILCRDRPAVVCEVHTSVDELRLLLEAEGYNVVRLGDYVGDYCQILARPA